MEDKKKKIKIDKKVLKNIEKISEKSFPKEACALLVGNKTENLVKIEKIIEAENILDDFDSFKIGPHFLVEKMEDIDEKDEELLGFFHSHPHSPPYVSEKDKKFMELWPEKIWLIAGVNEDGITNKIKAFNWSGEPIVLELSFES